jgi:NDP-sugar pyrophosphorylase family protein
MIPALVLTAGLATRLRPLSFVRGKAAVPVAGAPLAHRILRQLAAAGVTDAVLNLHHLPHTLTCLIGDGSDAGVRVRYSWEVPVLGSAGGPRRALPLLGAPTFLIANGDTLTDIEVAAVVADHQRSGALVTMAVVPNPEPDKYGGVLVDANGVVTGFARRGAPAPSHPRTVAPSHPRTVAPSHPRTSEAYHFVGIQVAEAEAFATVPDATPYESVAALYPALIASRPGAVRAFITSGEFLDIGTPDDYLRTSLLLARREHVPLHGRDAHIHRSARVEESVLWDDVEVGEGTLLRQCVVTDGVRVPADTSWVGVTMRVPNGELADGERVIEGIAIRSL